MVLESAASLRSAAKDGTKISPTDLHSSCDVSPVEANSSPDSIYGMSIPAVLAVEIARCIFDDGFNQGWYFTPATLDPSGKQCCVSRIVWQNIDGGKNDGGHRRIDGEQFTGPEEPYIDVVFWIFDPKTRSLVCISDKYLYEARSTRLPSDPESPVEQYIGPRVP
jgi:hypothetical protein